MITDGLKLTAYFGERARAGRRYLADELLDRYGRHRLAMSLLLRGAEGFGLHHRLQSQRLLSLSEDLPLVAVAVDARPRIQALLPEVLEVSGSGLVTLERARLVTGPPSRPELVGDLGEAVKLTVYLGRRERVAGRAGFVAVVDALREHGLAGASVFLGVDGTVRGARRRARLVGRNGGVPLMVVSVGAAGAVARALPALEALLPQPLMTLERVLVCKRDGQLLADPGAAPAAGQGLPGAWQQLTVYTSEQARAGAVPLYVELVHQLRAAGASGATALRGIWGYHGDHPPGGDRLLRLRRHVPVAVVAVDHPERVRRLFPLVDRLTERSGLVTVETVPAWRAAAADVVEGGLHLPAPGSAR